MNCPTCKGHGSVPNDVDVCWLSSPIMKCPTCLGLGEVNPCLVCGGEPGIYLFLFWDYCPGCNNTGMQPQIKT